MSYEFQSGFTGAIKDFLAYREAMGHAASGYKDFLANFDRFCVRYFPEKTVLTEEIVLAWCNDAKGNGGATRGSIIRGLGRHLIAEGQDAYILPATFFPRKVADLPQIFNDVELKRFFEATDRYPHRKESPLLEYTVPVIFRLQFSCGLRPQEVRLLHRLDFDFNNGTIYITESKRHKDRKLPVNADVMKMCKNYDRIAESIVPGRTAFFPSPLGEAYTQIWLTQIFNKCWEMSGNVTGRGKCTPYSFRHNFAAHLLMRYMEEGKDLDSLLIYISTYMGHESFDDTYYYLQLIPERLSKMPFMRVDGIIPKIKEISL